MFIELFNKLELDAYTQRQKIEWLEWYLKTQVDTSKAEAGYDYEHILENGFYIRKMVIPADDLVIGMVHKTTHMNFLMSGKASIVSDDRLFTAEGPFQFESQKHTKKAVYAHTDVVYATLHETTKTDLNEIRSDTVYESDLSWIERML